MLPPSSTRPRELSASAIVPEICAPLSIRTSRHPSRPRRTTDECSAPDPAVNRSLSLAPAPPSSLVAEVKSPPEKMSVSSPAPSCTPPRIAPPAATVIDEAPAAPMIALRPSDPTVAPLLTAMVTELPLCTSVRMAATAAPVPPMTVPETDMVVAPLLERVTCIPSPAKPLTEPVVVIATAPEPLEVALMPLSVPSAFAAVIVMPAPEESSIAEIPSPPLPMTGPLTLMEIEPPPKFFAVIASRSALISLPPADWVKVRFPLPPCFSRLNPAPEVSTGVSEKSVT